MKFMYLVFTRVPGESYRRRISSLLLYLRYVFRALINCLVCLLPSVKVIAQGVFHGANPGRLRSTALCVYCQVSRLLHKECFMVQILVGCDQLPCVFIAKCQGYCTRSVSWCKSWSAAINCLVCLLPSVKVIAQGVFHGANPGRLQSTALCVYCQVSRLLHKECFMVQILVGCNQLPCVFIAKCQGYCTRSVSWCKSWSAAINCLVCLLPSVKVIAQGVFHGANPGRLQSTALCVYCQVSRLLHKECFMVQIQGGCNISNNQD